MRLRHDPPCDRVPDKRGLQGARAGRYVQRDLHPRVRDRPEDRARQLQQQQGLPILLTESTHAQAWKAWRGLGDEAPPRKKRSTEVRSVPAEIGLRRAWTAPRVRDQLSLPAGSRGRARRRSPERAELLRR